MYFYFLRSLRCIDVNYLPVLTVKNIAQLLQTSANCGYSTLVPQQAICILEGGVLYHPVQHPVVNHDVGSVRSTCFQDILNLYTRCHMSLESNSTERPRDREEASQAEVDLPSSRKQNSVRAPSEHCRTRSKRYGYSDYTSNSIASQKETTTNQDVCSDRISLRVKEAATQISRLQCTLPRPKALSMRVSSRSLSTKC